MEKLFEELKKVQARLSEINSLAKDEENRSLTEEEQKEFMQPILDRYEHEGSAYFSTARLWDDGILDPTDTRNAIALALSACLNTPIPDHNFGVFRM